MYAQNFDDAHEIEIILYFINRLRVLLQVQPVAFPAETFVEHKLRNWRIHYFPLTVKIEPNAILEGAQLLLAVVLTFLEAFSRDLLRKVAV